MTSKWPYYVCLCILCAGVLVNHSGCVDPAAPEFRFRDGFILVNGQVTSEVGGSRVTISRSRREGSFYRLEPYEPTLVEVIDDQGNAVRWEKEAGGTDYLAPPGFAGERDRAYFIRIVTPGDRVIESAPERMPSLVPITRLREKFDQEAYYSDNLRRFVPSFRLLVDFRDPPDEENYYSWRFTTWEKVDFCLTCRFSRVTRMDGICRDDPGSFNVSRWDYLCQTDCFRFGLSSRVNVFSDEFVNGNLVTDYEIGRDDWDCPGRIMIVAEQQSITKGAFRYQNLLRELSEGSGGLNATLPAALDGNVDPVDPDGPPALGYFGAAAVDRANVFFDRDTVSGFPLAFDLPNFDLPLRPYRHPCEGFRRTPEAPPEWPW